MKENITSFNEYNNSNTLHKEDYSIFEGSDGSRYWSVNGRLHREDGPAIEAADGTKYWYRNDKLHREDGPAVEDVSGSRYWYIDNHLHREDGPAVEHINGNKEWLLNGKYHREDGPAFEYSDCRQWYLKGTLLTILVKEQLTKHMETYSLTVAHLLTDNDEVVRTSAAKYDWRDNER